MEDDDDSTAATEVPGPIFLSHAGQDAAGRLLAPWIRKELDLNKRRVFFDEESISAGQKLAPAISQAVQSCSLFVALVTPSYYKSKWPLLELHEALQHDRHLYVIVLNTTVAKVKSWVSQRLAPITWRRKGLLLALHNEDILKDMQQLFECKAMWCSSGSPLKNKWDHIASTVASDIMHLFPTAGLVLKLSEEEYVPSRMIAAFHRAYVVVFAGTRRPKHTPADESGIADCSLSIELAHTWLPPTVR
jgi:hypothetical protein